MQILIFKLNDSKTYVPTAYILNMDLILRLPDSEIEFQQLNVDTSLIRDFILADGIERGKEHQSNAVCNNPCGKSFLPVGD